MLENYVYKEIIIKNLCIIKINFENLNEISITPKPK